MAQAKKQESLLREMRVMDKVRCSKRKPKELVVFLAEDVKKDGKLFAQLVECLKNGSNVLKGVSSHHLMSRFPHLRRKYYGGHMWSSGKFYRSVGSTTDRAVKHYIECSQGEWKTFKPEVELLQAGQTNITDYL